MADIRSVTLYAHRDKDSNWDQWTELGGDEDDAGRNFSYAGYEITLGCTVDMDTGDVMCTRVNGGSLRAPVTLN